MPRHHHNLLKKLASTYCRLRPSRLAGVGIFAIRDIPPDTNPFPGVRRQRWYKLSPSQLRSLDPAIMEMVSDFYGAAADKTFAVPDCALNSMDISFFLNTSKLPNVKAINGGANFRTHRKIKKDEELTVSYASYDHRYRKK